MHDPRSRGAARRDSILRTAREILINEGLDGFVLRRIADRAGMKLGHLQYYFATRDDLLESIARDEFDNDLAVMTAANNEDPSQELLDLVALLTSRWPMADGSVYLPIGLLALHSERFAKLRTETYERFYDALGKVIERIDPDAARPAIRQRAILITALLDGASIQHLPTRGPNSPRQLAHRLGQLALTIARGD